MRISDWQRLDSSSRVLQKRLGLSRTEQEGRMGGVMSSALKNMSAPDRNGKHDMCAEGSTTRPHSWQEAQERGDGGVKEGGKEHKWPQRGGTS